MFIFLFAFLFLLGPLPSAAAPPDGEVLEYRLEVSFQLPASRIMGTAAIPVRQGRELRLEKAGLEILEVLLDKEVLPFADDGEAIKISAPRAGLLSIRYAGVFPAAPPPPSSGGAGTLTSPSNRIDDRGISLTGVWYPQPEAMARYHLTVELPEGFEAISEAEEIRRTTRNGTTRFSFIFSHPLDSLNLVASNRYRISKVPVNGISLEAYFFQEDQALAAAYLDEAKRYLELYEALLGKFPYRRFAIVENFLPTGISLPTFTLLGRDVVHLPFIVKTSLGHEILHQWFGNSVYVDDARGNWAEGLTTYLADHLYAEREGNGPAYRKEALIRYQSYVNAANDFPLSRFRGGGGPAARAIGYGKAMMVFHMLKNEVGEEIFYDSLRTFIRANEFRRAGWSDLQKAFAGRSGKELSWFFRQWVEEKGVADLALEKAGLKAREGRWEVNLSAAQQGMVRRLGLQVAVASAAGTARQTFALDQEKSELRVPLNELPRRVAVDENYDIARTLSPEEFPPVIARLLGETKRIVILPPSKAEIYQEVIDGFKARGDRVAAFSEVAAADLNGSSLLLLGTDNPLIGRLYGRLPLEAGFNLTVKEHPWAPGKVVGTIQARSPAESRTAFPKIFHYGAYSAVSFEAGRNVLKKTEESRRGLTREILPETVVADPSALRTLPEMVERLADRSVIYVGETHDQFAHHLVQLEVIQTLHQKGRKVAIGMEMFQRPFQQVVDEYVAGRIDEGTFLRRTEYFQRWQFDYELYRPILQFARREKIPVVALNIRKEIVEKVSRGGLDALPEEEKKLIPSQMDFGDRGYRDRLDKIFREHKSHAVTNADFFYQAQVLWDESMAESVAAFLRDHPGLQMVVLAGSGHLTFGSGIPRRAARRNGLPYAIILNDTDPEKGIATYLVYPGRVPLEKTPRLMITSREEDGKVIVASFSEESAAENAGLKIGDAILAVADTPVKTVGDIRIELLALQKGDKVKVKALRQTPAGPKEMEFEVFPR